jgi:hypothetical protein
MMGRVSVDSRPTWTSKKPIRWLIRKPAFPLPTLDHGYGRAAVLGEAVRAQRQAPTTYLEKMSLAVSASGRSMPISTSSRPGADWRSGWASRTMRSSSAWEIISAVTALEDLLEHDDLADRLVALGDDDVERLVEHDLLGGPQLAELDPGADAYPHLAAAGEQVGAAVLDRLQEDPEPGRRLGQPVDLFLQRDDLVPCLAQGCGEPFVLAGRAA